jgi:TrmH family RNA methyltransferase
MADRSFAESLSPDIPAMDGHHRELLSHLRIVLVEPQHAGNIGSTARAMNVCGVSDLHLVNPVPWRDSDEAWQFGYGSRPILDEAREVATVEEAIAGAHVVIGTTRRIGRARGPMVPPRVMAAQMPAMLRGGTVAILFGREDFGLSNDDLARCQLAVNVPAAVDHPSLNLAQAVLVVVYEAFMGVVTERDEDRRSARPDPASVDALSERIAALAERAGYEHRRGHVGLVRSLRKGLRESDVSLNDTRLVHMLCTHLERYMSGLEHGLTPDEARNAPPR